jgi:hypothetical protein
MSKIIAGGDIPPLIKYNIENNQEDFIKNLKLGYAP